MYKDNDKLRYLVKTYLQNKEKIWLFSFNKIIIELLNSNSNEYIYWSYFLLNIEKKEDCFLKSPAAVYFKNNKYVIVFNPILMSLLPIEEQIGILLHEIMHIIYLHLLVDEKKYKDLDKLNIAQDLTINGYKLYPFIKNLPGATNTSNLINGCFFDDFFEKNVVTDFINESKNQSPYTSEQLYEYLLSNNCAISKKNKIKLDISNLEKLTNQALTNLEKNDCTIEEESINKILDIISNMNDLDEQLGYDYNNLDDIMLFELKHIIEKTNKTFEQNNRGKIPSQIINCLIEIEKRSTTINWKVALKKEFGNYLNKLQKELKFGYQHPIYYKNPNIPGYDKNNNFIKISVLLDVSGSMSDEFINIHLNEIKNLCKIFNFELDLIQVDTRVVNFSKINKNTKILNRKANGGTILEPGFEYISSKKLNPNIILVLTDGFIEKDFKNYKLDNKTKVFWITSKTLNFNIKKYSNQMKVFYIKETYVY